MSIIFTRTSDSLKKYISCRQENNGVLLLFQCAFPYYLWSRRLYWFVPVGNLSLIHLAHFAQESGSPSYSSNSCLEILPEEETIGETHVLIITWTCSYVLSSCLHWNHLRGSLKSSYLSSTQYLQNANIRHGVWGISYFHRQTLGVS